jgi:hypothetical protein
MSQPIVPVLLDTDILSAVMRQQAAALAHARAYLGVHVIIHTSPRLVLS